LLRVTALIRPQLDDVDPGSPAVPELAASRA
jgi:hypothetical protein